MEEARGKPEEDMQVMHHDDVDNEGNNENRKNGDDDSKDVGDDHRNGGENDHEKDDNRSPSPSPSPSRSPSRSRDRSRDRGRDRSPAQEPKRDRSRERSPQRSRSEKRGNRHGGSGRSRGRDNRRSDRGFDDVDRRGRGGRRDNNEIADAKVYVKADGIGSGAILESDLEDAFAKFGRIKKIWVSRHPDRNFAFVDFENAADADEAVARMNHTELMGRPLLVEISRAKPASNVKPGDWICGSCGLNNFARRTACFKCGAPKPFGTPRRQRQGRSRSRGRGGRGRGPRPSGREMPRPRHQVRDRRRRGRSRSHSDRRPRRARSPAAQEVRHRSNSR